MTSHKKDNQLIKIKSRKAQKRQVQLNNLGLLLPGYNTRLNKSQKVR
jgi:hypothetical protein